MGFILEIPQVMYQAFAPTDTQELMKRINTRIDEFKILVYHTNGQILSMVVSPLCCIALIITLLIARRKLHDTADVILRAALAAGCDGVKEIPKNLGYIV